MGEPLDLFGLEWARPAGFAVLVLALAVALLARRLGRAVEVWTGTGAAWREALTASPTAGTRPRGLPLSVWCFLGALVLGALALAGPRAARGALERSWTCVVDRSPSMFLPVAGAAGGTTRLERAVESARRVLDRARAELGAVDDPVEWVTYGRTGIERALGDRPPSAWLAAPRNATEPPPWRAHDRPGTLWVSDGIEDLEPAHAGLALSGGEAVPGPVAQVGARRVVWDGRGLVEEPGEHARPGVVFPEDLPAALARVLEAWIEARGCHRIEGDAAELAVVWAPSADEVAPEPIELGRDGWSWTVEALAGAPRGEVWRVEPAGRAPAIAWSPGRVELARGTYGEPRGDPAAFAVSWSELFDRALRAPRGVVEVRERRAVGPARTRAPSRAAEAPGPGPSPAPDAWLAGLALAAGLAGLWAARR